MSAKITADATGTKVTIGNAAEDALQIDATAKTIKAVSPYLLSGNGPYAKFTGTLTTTSGAAFASLTLTPVQTSGIAVSGPTATPGKAGWYQCSVQARWGAIATGKVQLLMSLAGNAFFASIVPNDATQQSQIITALQYFNGTTDSLIAQAAQDSGSALNCVITGQMVLVREG